MSTTWFTALRRSDRSRNDSPTIESVLFDLDGTLLDTAPDMGGSLNDLRAEHGIGALPYDTIRPQVSHGAAALLRLGFGVVPSDHHFEALRKRFLDIYRGRLSRETRPFPGMGELLDRLEEESIPWGVVTNKPGWLTEPLLDELGLLQRARVVISGDATPNLKPHPEPLFLASRAIGVSAEQCLYVGDAERDIQAGNRAGMHTAAALFGYIDVDEDVAAWGADHAVEHALALFPLVFGSAPSRAET